MSSKENYSAREFSGEADQGLRPARGRVEFETRDYEFSHGRKPRGRGSWAFAFKPNAPLTEAFWVEGGETTYAEAKRLAAAEARRRNVSRVWVLP